MLRFSKRDSKKMIKEVARLRGISVSELQAQMKTAIEEAKNNPHKQAEFQKLFGNRTPTPEEFICTISKQLKY